MRANKLICIAATAASVALASIGCSSQHSDETTGKMSRQHLDDGTYPQIDFSTQPSYLPSKTLALTFDDGPDYTNTAKVLDILKSNNVKAAFFINTQNWSNVDTDAPMQDLVRRIV